MAQPWIENGEYWTLANVKGRMKWRVYMYFLASVPVWAESFEKSSYAGSDGAKCLRRNLEHQCEWLVLDVYHKNAQRFYLWRGISNRIHDTSTSLAAVRRAIALHHTAARCDHLSAVREFDRFSHQFKQHLLEFVRRTHRSQRARWKFVRRTYHEFQRNDKIECKTPTSRQRIGKEEPRCQANAQQWIGCQIDDRFRCVVVQENVNVDIARWNELNVGRRIGWRGWR